MRELPEPHVAGLHQLLDRETSQSASRMLRPPAAVRLVAGVLAAALPLLATLLLAIPWQQAALGTGRVIAYAPQEREQAVQAPVSGRIERWMVQEGQQVAEGDPLVELRDNDPFRLDRLERTQDAAGRQRDILEMQVRSYENKLTAEKASRELVVAEYAAKMASLQRKRVGVVAEVEVESQQADRLETLAKEGIAAQRDYELARLKRDQAMADLEALDQEIAASRQALGKARADGDAKVASVQADLEEARAKLTEQEQKQLSIQGSVQRQAAQLVTAPRAGRLLQFSGVPGGGQVKEGDTLLVLVPDTDARAVELFIDGNDMPLVNEGSEVRLLFEGWPALQFVGFPGADAGTFAGRVSFVDATDDGNGRFRLVVSPDHDNAAWPDADRLRQGVRAKGWVLFGQVSLGYELWRQLNGFPPLPPVQKGESTRLPTFKKPRAPQELK